MDQWWKNNNNNTNTHTHIIYKPRSVYTYYFDTMGWRKLCVSVYNKCCRRAAIEQGHQTCVCVYSVRVSDLKLSNPCHTRSFLEYIQSNLTKEFIMWKLYGPKSEVRMALKFLAVAFIGLWFYMSNPKFPGPLLFMLDKTMELRRE